MKTLLPLMTLLAAALLRAEPVTQPLKIGDTVPDVSLLTLENTRVDLRRLVARKPTVLIFYRGGWCPFCTAHLQALAGVEAEIQRAGAQLIAISMDQPEVLRATPQREELGYTLLSDRDAAAARAFGIAFRVDDATVEKYRGYGIDLEAASGRNHHLLPHPAVFVVSPKGVIRFAHVNPDYRSRLEPGRILEAVRSTSP